MEGFKGIYVLGIGRNTPVLIDLALSCGYKILGLYHYNEEYSEEMNYGFQIIGSFSDLFNAERLDGQEFLLTMGDNNIRTKLSCQIRQLGGLIPTLIHPMAVISHFAKISPIGVYIFPFTCVQADSSIGDNTVLLSHVNISHTTKIGNSCFIAGGAIIGAYTIVEDYVFVGQGALSVSGKVRRIGTNAYIGARALLVKDVEDFSVMMGSPAKKIR